MQISQIEILSNSKKTLKLAKVNISALSLFGISNDIINNFEAKITEAENLLNENFQKIELKELTYKKNQVLQDCYNWGRKLAIRIEIAFGKKSENMRNFPSKELLKAQKNEDKMLILMATLIKISQKYLHKLKDYGQNIDEIQKGINLKDNLFQSNNQQELKKEDKKRLTKLRKETFLKLYETVNNINKIGRIHFINEPAQKELFSCPWKKMSNKKQEIIISKINPGTTKIITDNIVKKTITIYNLGTTILDFYRTDNEEYTIFKTFNPSESKKIRITSLGDGKLLKVENKSENKIGEYKLLI